MTSCSSAHTLTVGVCLLLSIAFSWSSRQIRTCQSAQYTLAESDQCSEACGRATMWGLPSVCLSRIKLLLLAAPEPVRTSGADAGEGSLVSGCSHSRSPQQPAPKHHRRRTQELPHAVYSAHISVSHGKDRQRRK